MPARLLGIAIGLSITVPVSQALQIGRPSSGAPSVNFYEIFEKAATAPAVVPLHQICQEYHLDDFACKRFQIYIGSTLANATQPIEARHSVYSSGARYTTANAVLLSGLKSPAPWVTGDMRDAMQGFALMLSRYIPRHLTWTLPFITMCDDYAWRHRLKLPTFVRPDLTRNSDGNHVLTRMMHERYDTGVKAVPAKDVPFHAKSDTMLWRGDCSGNLDVTQSGRYWNHSRYLLADKWSRSNDPRVDVGLIGHECKDHGHGPDHWFKESVSMESLLRHKFLLVVEGNDVATQGEWVMASNSVPFMYPAVTQTWALQSLWVPWKHYVPIEPDYSDLSAKLDWAIAHPAEAERIANEGKRFMEEFRDEDREDRIQAAVVTAYFNRLRIKEAPAYMGILETDAPVSAWAKL